MDTRGREGFALPELMKSAFSQNGLNKRNNIGHPLLVELVYLHRQTLSWHTQLFAPSWQGHPRGNNCSSVRTGRHQSSALVFPFAAFAWQDVKEWATTSLVLDAWAIICELCHATHTARLPEVCTRKLYRHRPTDKPTTPDSLCRQPGDTGS